MLAEVELEFLDGVAGQMDELGPASRKEELEKRTNTEPVTVETGVPKRLEAEDIPTPVESSHERLSAGRGKKMNRGQVTSHLGA